MLSIKYIVTFALPFAAAYPWAMDPGQLLQRKRQTAVRQPAFLSGRPNNGVAGLNTFNAEAQYVDVTAGSGHEWQAPSSTDRRGPCPGLNAAANHDFIPRNGILNLQQTITGLEEAYNLAPDMSLALTVIAVATSGDFVTQRWSIGGSFASSLPGLLSDPKGITNTHSQYETDSSATRSDAYITPNNDTNTFFMPHWEHLYSLAEEYTLDDLAAHEEYVQTYSRNNNPYFFLAPVLGSIVAAAYNFVPQLMSNHSAEEPGGTLTREVLKSFYSVQGEPGSFVYTAGHERIPENWYKRPDLLLGPQVVADALINNQMYPGAISLGGNTGEVNTFTGVDLSDVTGGVYNAQTLLEGNNLACFALQATQAALPGQLDGIVADVGQLLNWVREQVSPLLDKWACPELVNFNNTLFNQFPGAAAFSD